jgi:hypothetical protein
MTALPAPRVRSWSGPRVRPPRVPRRSRTDTHVISPASTSATTMIPVISFCPPAQRAGEHPSLGGVVSPGSSTPHPSSDRTLKLAIPTTRASQRSEASSAEPSGHAVVGSTHPDTLRACLSSRTGTSWYSQILPLRTSGPFTRPTSRPSDTPVSPSRSTSRESTHGRFRFSCRFAPRRPLCLGICGRVCRALTTDRSPRIQSGVPPGIWTPLGPSAPALDAPDSSDTAPPQPLDEQPADASDATH